MIVVVVPTIRDECMKEFLTAWDELFKKHNVELVIVRDGDTPKILDRKYNLSEFDDLIFNKSDCCRNLGFAYVAKYLSDIEVIITLDDDVRPLGDTIQDHINALSMRVPISWMSTASEYMRGFPYGVRDEAEVVLSHGVWQGVKDWDAPTQLTLGNRDVTFYKGPIPKGIFYPMCIMNVAFKRKMLPYMYQAPMGPKVGLDRFADIWSGIESKKVIDSKGWAVVSGYATVKHERASNVFVNLVKEAKGLGMNENYGADEYFKFYEEKRKKWEELIK
jgi:reversibly glycosylated polypeptide/UDP-arabinopyranose mutase